MLDEGLTLLRALGNPYRIAMALNFSGDLARLEQACDDAGEQCRQAVDSCGNEAYADVVLDEERDVLDVICYPGNATVREIGVDTVPSAEAGNHTVLVLDDVDDGADVSGDVTLTVAGQTLALPRGRSVTLQLARQFSWQLDRLAPQGEQVPPGRAGMEILLRP